MSLISAVQCDFCRKLVLPSTGTEETPGGWYRSREHVRGVLVALHYCSTECYRRHSEMPPGRKTKH